MKRLALAVLIVNGFLSLQVLAESDWRVRVESSRKLIADRRFDEAQAALDEIRKHALQTRNDEEGLEALRLLVAIARSHGNWQQTEDLLNEELDFSRRLSGGSPESDQAAIYSQLASVRRAQHKFAEAVAALEGAIRLRSGPAAESVEAARDLTTLGLIYAEMKRPDAAKESLVHAVERWNALLRDDPEVLSAVESLAGLYRDEADYAAAGPLYSRALRIREIAFGPDSAEVLGGIDNLAYCYFGDRKFADAELLYQRLLALWELTAGPEHPMVALTLDKMVTFYSEQKRFEEAASLAERAGQIRARALVSSFRSRASLAAQQDKGQSAVDWVTKAERVRDLTGLPKPEQRLMPPPAIARPVRTTRKAPTN